MSDEPQFSSPARLRVIESDARDIPLEDNTVDLVVTSPPYWQKRDYGFSGQIGQEEDPDEFVDQIMEALREWRRALRPTGSVFLNIGDTYHKRSLVGIPGRIERAAQEDGWLLRNRIVWTKDGGMPEPAKNRLANRNEFILHLTQDNDYYYDLFQYANTYGNGSNPGDVWNMDLERNMGDHLAPYPTELAERAITAACPERVCPSCGSPYERIVKRTTQLDPSRPQARRAMEIAEEEGLTEEHIRAVQASGITDAGKAREIQNGTDRNSEEVTRLAKEAKEVLGGYFREFTFAKRATAGWSSCECDAGPVPGVVLDPFMGSGTTLQAAAKLGRSGVGVDLSPPDGIQTALESHVKAEVVVE